MAQVTRFHRRSATGATGASHTAQARAQSEASRDPHTSGSHPKAQVPRRPQSPSTVPFAFLRFSLSSLPSLSYKHSLYTLYFLSTPLSALCCLFALATGQLSVQRSPISLACPSIPVTYCQHYVTSITLPTTHRTTITFNSANTFSTNL